jgi:hypothetical protein
LNFLSHIRESLPIALGQPTAAIEISLFNLPEFLQNRPMAALQLEQLRQNDVNVLVQVVQQRLVGNYGYEGSKQSNPLKI